MQLGSTARLSAGAGCSLIDSPHLTSRYLMDRFTFGPALFVAWIGGGLLIIGGVLKCVAFRSLHAESTP